MDDWGEPRPIMLGLEWFPDRRGGLNRYFRGLHAALGEPPAVVVGPVADPPAALVSAGTVDGPVVPRLVAFARVASAHSGDANLVDAHFAETAFLPVFGPLRRLPLVVHFQGPWAAESRSAGQRSGPRLLAKVAIERAVYRRACELVTLSGAFKRLLVERYGVQPWHITPIPPAVDTQQFVPGDRRAARHRIGLPQDAWVVVTLRRLVPRTGVDVLLDAWSKLAREEHERPWVLAVLGEGAERAALEKRARLLGINASTRFIGAVDDEELRGWYQAADLSIVPSTELEGFGLVVLESAACGTPAVVSDVGGLRAAISPLDESLVVPPADVNELARRIAEAERGEIPSRSACRAYAEQHTWSKVADATRSVYGRAISRERRRRLRVVYLDHCADLSGGELALLRLLPALTDVEAHVILAQEGQLATLLVDVGVSVEVLPLSENARGLRKSKVGFGVSTIRAAVLTAVYSVRLARRLRRLRPDLVHTNSLKAGVFGCLAARLAGIPVIWHVRDRIAPDYLPRRAVYVLRWLIPRVATEVIANSRTTLETLARLERRASVVPTPVVHDPVFGVPPRQRDAPRGGLLVGTIGRIAPWKGQHLFLEAFALAFPDGTARAWIVGAPLFGENEYERSLHQLVDRLGIANRVEFRGFRKDVSAELLEIDILVHSAVIPEPFGQVILEGMAAAVPVVAPSAGGPAELIDDEHDGLLYEPENVSDLADRLRRLAADPELRLRLGDAGRAKAQAYAPEVIATRVTAIYDSVLAL